MKRPGSRDSYSRKKISPTQRRTEPKGKGRVNAALPSTRRQSGALVLIASSLPQVRAWWSDGIRGMYTTEEAPDLVALRRCLVTLKPSVLVLDLALPDLCGVKGVPAILRLSPLTKVLLLSANTGPEDAETIYALKAGAHGYGNRDMDPFLMKKAVETVQKGEIWVKRSVILGVMRDLITKEPVRESKKLEPAEIDSFDYRFSPLTPREREIVLMIGSGARNKEIANLLKITEPTVKAHLTAVFRKLDIPDRLHLALMVSTSKHIQQNGDVYRGSSVSAKS